MIHDLSSEMDTIIREAEVCLPVKIVSAATFLIVSNEDTSGAPLSVDSSSDQAALCCGRSSKVKELDVYTRRETTEVIVPFLRKISGPLLHLVAQCCQPCTGNPRNRVEKENLHLGRSSFRLLTKGNQIVISVSTMAEGFDRGAYSPYSYVSWYDSP